MSDGGSDQDTAKGRLSLRPAGRGDVGRTVDGGSVRQSFSHGRSKVVQVEVKKKRSTLAPPAPSSRTVRAMNSRRALPRSCRAVSTNNPLRGCFNKLL